jgi:hypothetical protein
VTPHIHERFLQRIWDRQFLHSTSLHTADGRPVVVEHAGVLNTDAGPDVRRARIRIGDTVYSGDVEIHRTMGEWWRHRHHEDPAYNGVILHVILERPAPHERATTRSGRDLPLLVLGDFLPDPVRVLWERAILDDHAGAPGAIRCSRVNREVPLDIILPWLEHLARERLEVKMRRFEERLRDLAIRRKMTMRERPPEWGEIPEEDSPDRIPPPEPELRVSDLSERSLWDQVLYEGMMEGLGYSKNRRPFIRLSQHLTLEVLWPTSGDAVLTEAWLFGVAGLLPARGTPMSEEAAAYVDFLRAAWESLSTRYRGERLSPVAWVLSPTRPANAPTLRLVAARDLVRKILHLDLFRSLMLTVAADAGPAATRATLHRLLEPEPGPFWERRVSFTRTARTFVSALGFSRRDELVINTVLPLAWLYARVFRRPAVREGVGRLLAWYPPSATNTLTARMERQFVRKRFRMANAQTQQALVQLYKYYCEDERCNECAVGRYLWGERKEE